MKLASTEAMARIDKLARERYAMPSLLLMENAGIKAWSLFRRWAGKGEVPAGGMVFVAGRGNNGGDALVMARQAFLDGVRDLAVVLAGGRPQAAGESGQDLAMCESLGIECLAWPAQGEQCRNRLAGARWIFDGVAGTGIRGALQAPLSELVEAMNGSAGRRIAIDVPSGVRDGFQNGDPAVRADLTLTMGLPKLSLYLPRARGFCGRIQVVRLGFPPALVEDPAIPGESLDEDSWRGLLAPIPDDAHKGTRGHLAVFAGSRGMTGAASLAACAAARSRTGLVSLFLDPEVYPLVAPGLRSVMAKPSGAPGTGFDPSAYSAALVGPGWGLAADRERWLECLLSTGLPGVIDADALTLLGRLKTPALGGRWVLTPHPGEFARLCGIAKEEVLSDPPARAMSMAASRDAVVVLKGASTCVAAPSGRFWILDGRNPALATGGSGDVLAGIIAGGMASGMPPLEAALFGVSLHARVGRIARRLRGWFLAEDLLPLVSRTLGRADSATRRVRTPLEMRPERTPR